MMKRRWQNGMLFVLLAGEVALGADWLRNGYVDSLHIIRWAVNDGPGQEWALPVFSVTGRVGIARERVAASSTRYQHESRPLFPSMISMGELRIGRMQFFGAGMYWDTEVPARFSGFVAPHWVVMGLLGILIFLLAFFRMKVRRNSRCGGFPVVCEGR
jgi:hypothetical protein